MTDFEPLCDPAGLILLDPWLEPFADRIRARCERYRSVRTALFHEQPVTGPMSQGHRIFGLTRGEHNGKPGVWFREWAPAAEALSLIGDFNGWNREADPLARGEWGVWYRFLPDDEYAHRLTHGSGIKVHVRSAIGAMDRIPAYIRRVVQEPNSALYTGQYWSPPEPFDWQHASPKRQGGLRIYEAHVGMAQEEGKVSTFREFTERTLPRIAALGYNAVQLMAVQEHPYYGSFGYHVSNFYAVSSRFGTPEDLKSLIDTAHGMGLKVIMDLVHSHAVKNMHEGLNRFDGTEYQYFHAGARGEHPAWDSLCFDYSRHEVLRFLLSNVRFWLEEYRFDGFRFDGVTSMLYLDHGLGKVFTQYEDYFGDNVDLDAAAYLMLANELAHAIAPNVVTIAEDVSGMPGLARPVSEGGIGFDYRLAMGIPDYWIKLLKETADEKWDLGEIFYRLMDRRYGEKHVGYAESHDQALVGDQTLAFRMMGARMYTEMSKFRPNLVVDRGVALHKMIRLITFALGGEGYLNFMGNEFGHPEWIDFPRPENGYSHQYARRQWSLADDTTLHYHELRDFDAAMLSLDRVYSLLEDPFIEQLWLDNPRRVLVFRHGPLVFVFNFHATESYADLHIPVPDANDYTVILDTDARDFGGFGRVASGVSFPWLPESMAYRSQSLRIYLPSRTALVLAPKEPPP